MEQLISVIVPVYNVEKYLDVCIQSIVKQTYKNLEIILIDDGSSDQSSKICDDWSKKDGRIKAFHQENQGAAMAKNQGLDIASGDLITFVDSDDCIKNNAYERLYQLMKAKRCDIVECNYQCFEKDIVIKDESIKEKIETCTNLEALDYLIDNSKMKQVVWNKLYKKETIKDIRFPKGRYIDDEFWTYKVVNQANKVCITDEKLYFYRQHSSSIMGRKYNVRRLDVVDALKERMLYIKEKQPRLENKATLSYIAMVMYQYQCLSLHKNQLDQDKSFRRKLFQDFRELKKSDFDKALMLSNNKYKLWYRLFYICPDFVCNVRNRLKIGL